MPIEKISVGAAANDGTGDPLRIAFEKSNRNFDQLASAVAAKISNLPMFASLRHEHDSYVPRFVSDKSPTEPPPVFGAMWVDTGSGRIYLATGTAAASDWREVRLAGS
jgi:hypothetical protein